MCCMQAAYTVCADALYQTASSTYRLIKTRGTGYHDPLIAYRANEREALRSLPDDLAWALIVTFQRKRNPFPVQRP